jgi:6-phosphogluconolactonase (cycloisomerase 2 family)
MAIDPTGRFCYVPNATTSDISSFQASATTGTLTALSPNVMTGNAPTRFTLLGDYR